MRSSAAPAARGGWGAWAAAAALAALTAAALGPALGCEFVNFDDPAYVTANPHVQAGLTAAGFRWAWATTHAANWHPLTWLSLMLDAQIYGGRAWGYHLTSLLLHAANALLLFDLFRRLTGAVWRSFFVAALFAVHPLHVESTAWVAERKDVLSTFFGLLALHAYAGYAAAPSAGRYLAVCAGLALSLLAKPMLVTLPCVLLLLDYWPLRRWRPGGVAAPDGNGPAPVPLRRLLLEKVPLLALSAASCAATASAQHAGGAVRSLGQVPPGERLANAAVSYVQYLRQAFWPRDLAPLYPHPRGGLGWEVASLAGLLLAAVTLSTLRQARRRPYLPVGWLWYLGTLVPVLGLVQVGPQARADRYTYVPLVGVFVVLVWGAAELTQDRQRRRVLAGLGAAALVALALVSRAQVVACWSTSEALWSHTLAVTGANPFALQSLGILRGEQGRPGEAERYFREAVRAEPGYAPAHAGLGTALEKLGRTDEAVGQYREAVRLDPHDALTRFRLGNALERRGQIREAAGHYQEAARAVPGPPEAAYARGVALARIGRTAEAVAQLGEVVRLTPDSDGARYELGQALEQQGRLGEALPHLRRAAELSPSNLRYRIDLASVLYRLGHKEEAAAEYRESLRLVPGWPASLNKAAWEMAAHPDAGRRNPAEAVALAGKVCEATRYQEPAFLDTLSAAYASAGRFGEATATARRALRLAGSGTPPGATGPLEERLKLYERGRPFRDPTLR